MKHTLQRTRTLYNAFKPKVATLVSTFILAACTAAPAPAFASNYIPNSSYAKLCYTTSSLVYSILQIKDPEKAIERLELLVEENEGAEFFNEGLEQLLYVGLTKRNIYKGENLKQVLMLECPAIFRAVGTQQ